MIVRVFFAPCERCGENVADPKDADRWTTHLHARLKLFAHWTFRTLKSRANANPVNGCTEEAHVSARLLTTHCSEGDHVFPFLGL